MVLVILKTRYVRQRQNLSMFVPSLGTLGDG